ncbi:thiamine kinase [Vibrio xiamenensis]|uniref:Thiamine kinase n=1 Tax=Vibrio xiamenensis TaxID=861298 RepID=A0A1G7WRS1_9VIBR|nr:phosphotransferase [Vibrio xiamenensis]SDG74588.1 thiamine kinase [Vibrio xiamenensis]
MARMSWQEACQLDDSLASLDSLFSLAPDYARTLTGGLTNRCWKIVLRDGSAYVWRPTTHITQAFSISRIQEYQILTTIEPSRIGPKPIYINGHGLLVEWIEGESLTKGLSFESLLKSLVRVHSFPTARIPIAPFNYTARVDHYWIRLESRYKSEAYQAIYHKWRQAPSLVPVDLTLCHFDLAGYNMVDTPLGHRIIDWEYASIADPRLDLALCIDIAEESPYEAVARYCQLRNLIEVDDWIAGVQAWQPRATMMALLWYLLAHQLWGDEQYLSQAQQLLEGL